MSENSILLAKIKEALDKEETKHEHIHLKVVDGVVFLDGEAESNAEKEGLEESIRKIEGVRFVQNRLQVNAHDTPDQNKPFYPGS